MGEDMNSKEEKLEEVLDRLNDYLVRAEQNGVFGLAPFRLTHSLCGVGRRIVKRSLVVDWAEPAGERVAT